MPFSVFPGVSMGAPWGIRGDPGGSREAFQEDVGPRAGKLTVSRFWCHVWEPLGSLGADFGCITIGIHFLKPVWGPLGGLPGPLASPKKGSWELPGGKGGDRPPGPAWAPQGRVT